MVTPFDLVLVALISLGVFAGIVATVDLIFGEY